MSEINKSDYHLSDEENDRLGIQSSMGIGKTFIPYFEELQKYTAPIILDIGCGNVMHMFDRLGPIKDYTYVGIDLDANVIAANKENYDMPNFHFYQCDVDSNFKDVINQVKQELNITSFDVIVVSLVLKHIKNRVGLLQNCREIMSSPGSLIIDEYDAGMNMFYPDNNGYFKKINDIFERDKTLGDRYTGRKVYSWLIQSGFEDIEIPVIGNSTAGFGEMDKANLWEAEFSYLTQDCIEMVEKYNTNDYKEDLKWCQENLDKAREEFLEPELLYITGVILYIARK